MHCLNNNTYPLFADDLHYDLCSFYRRFADTTLGAYL